MESESHNKQDSREVSKTESALRQEAVEAGNKPGRRMKFMANKPTKSKAMFVVGGFVAFLLVGYLLLSLVGQSQNSSKKDAGTSSSGVIEERDLPDDNNSTGYLQSSPANFGNNSLNLNYTQPEFIASKSDTVKLNQQASWQNGFAVMAVGYDRDYRPSSEFNYKRISQSGDELVRVNFLVGNATNANMPIGYDDLKLYAKLNDGSLIESERIDEDSYSPKNGQVLGGKQTRKVSLHYRVKRGSTFSIFKSKKFDQPRAKEKEGQEKEPTLSLTINIF